MLIEDTSYAAPNISIRVASDGINCNVMMLLAPVINKKESDEGGTM